MNKKKISDIQKEILTKHAEVFKRLRQHELTELEQAAAVKRKKRHQKKEW